MPLERAIPILPCHSIDEQLAYYEAIGFVVTYRQKAPNVYAVVQRDDVELHFFVLKGLDPTSSYSSCYVFASDIDALYAAFRAGMKTALGRVPTRGVPRIGSLRDMSYGVRQFLMTDPGGNTVRFGQPLATVVRAVDGEPRGRLARALDAAVLLGESKGDPETAAHVIDAALEAEPTAPIRLRVRAWVLRAESAQTMGDDARAIRLLDDVAGTVLSASDQTALADDLARAADLRRTLGGAGT